VWNRKRSHPLKRRALAGVIAGEHHSVGLRPQELIGQAADHHDAEHPRRWMASPAPGSRRRARPGSSTTSEIVPSKSLTTSKRCGGTASRRSLINLAIFSESIARVLVTSSDGPVVLVHQAAGRLHVSAACGNRILAFTGPMLLDAAVRSSLNGSG
jgi:hypothetical protein